MLCASFCSKVPKATSSVLRTHARHPVKSNAALLLRGYATHKARPANRISPPRPPPPPRSNVPSLHGIPGRRPPPSSGDSTLEKIRTAERLFKADDKILYRSTRRTTVFRVNSWAILLTAGLGAYLLWDNGLLNINTFYRSGHGYPMFIVIGESVACIFFGGIIAIAALRVRKHIHSIHLIQQSGRVQLQVTCRGALPFMKESFIVQPQQFTVSDPFGAVAHLPDSLIPSAPSESGGPGVFVAGVIRESFKSISRSFYSFYEYFNTYFTGSGLFKIDIMGDNKGTTQYTMDASAEYLLNKQNLPALWDVVEVRSPYDNI